jgi:hypothetical protein
MAVKLNRFQRELLLYFKARFTLICVVTPEEERVLKDIAEACRDSDKPAYTWDIADGFVPLTDSTGRPRTPFRPLR